jgi:hypothetical protein
MHRFLALAFIVAVIGAIMPVRAQDGGTTPPPTVADRMQQEQFWAVGLQAGITTGMGLSVRTVFPNRFAVEAQGGYLSVSDGVWSAGIEGQFQLDYAYDHRLYALAGFGAFFDGDTASKNTLKQPTRLGIGIGYEYFMGQKTVLGFEVPITFFIGGGEKVQVLPIPQLQFMYYFN